MKKYMFVITNISNGGAERVISVLSTALTEQGQEVCVVKYYETENEYPVGDKVTIINLSKGKLSDYEKISYIEKVRRLRKIIKVEKPDFVLPFLLPVALCTEIASKGLRTTVIQSIRIDPAISPVSKYLRKIRDRLVYRSKCTLVQSEAQKQYFPQRYHKRIHVLFNPVSEKLLSAEWKPAEDQYIVCGVGRLEKQKNFELLMDAFQKAFHDVPQAVLKIYGAGSQLDALKEYATKLDVGNRIILMGRTGDILSAYQEASLFVLSSDFEGMPNALIEAMAVGVPCISTDCPTGPADLIVHKDNGLLIPVNDKAAMIQALQQMYELRNEMCSMSRAAKEAIKSKCSDDQIAKQLISITEKIP